MTITKLRINTIDEARDDVVFTNIEGTSEYVFPKDNIATIIRTGVKDDTPVNQ